VCLIFLLKRRKLPTKKVGEFLKVSFSGKWEVWLGCSNHHLRFIYDPNDQYYHRTVNITSDLNHFPLWLSPFSYYFLGTDFCLKSVCRSWYPNVYAVTYVVPYKGVFMGLRWWGAGSGFGCGFSHVMLYSLTASLISFFFFYNPSVSLLK
jgi:hypothetical protein